MSFSQGFFIETIQRFPCIWDIKNEEHKHKEVIEAAWLTIASICEDTVEACQDEWRSIRVKFTRERKRYLKAMPSASASYTGDWELFNQLGFLAPHVQIRRPKRNVYMKRKSEDLVGLSKVGGNIKSEIFPSPSSSSSQSRVTPDENVDNQPGSRDKTSMELTKVAETVSNVGESMNLFLKQQQHFTPVETPNKGREDYYFAMSLAESLEKIRDNKKKLLLKAKILTMIAEATDDL